MPPRRRCGLAPRHLHGPTGPSSDSTAPRACLLWNHPSGSRAKQTTSQNVVIKRGRHRGCPQVTEERRPLGDRHPDWPLRMPVLGDTKGCRLVRGQGSSCGLDIPPKLSVRRVRREPSASGSLAAGVAWTEGPGGDVATGPGRPAGASQGLCGLYSVFRNPGVR